LKKFTAVKHTKDTISEVAVTDCVKLLSGYPICKNTYVCICLLILLYKLTYVRRVYVGTLEYNGLHRLFKGVETHTIVTLTCMNTNAITREFFRHVHKVCMCAAPIYKHTQVWTRNTHITHSYIYMYIYVPTYIGTKGIWRE
jgi:hypothetical protein